MKVKTITIVSYLFSEANLQKQPWSYIHELAKELKAKGYKISAISDGGKRGLKKETVDGLTVYRLKKIRQSQQGAIREVLSIEKPGLIIWPIGPKSFTFLPLLKKLKIPVIGFLSYSLYSLKEVILAQITLGRYNLLSFFQNALIPGFLFRNFINSEVLKGVIVLSRRSQSRMLKLRVKPEKIWVLPQGTDKQVSSAGIDKEEKTVLYLGGPEDIRGLKFLARTFKEALAEDKQLRLIVLLRTNKQQALAKIRQRCDKLGILARVRIIGGILSKEEVIQYISASSFVALPFILVPSEIPISILEAMKLGKPVIGTNLDGIPELIENKGVIVEPGSRQQLKKAILRLAYDEEYRQKLRNNCLSFMAGYPSWDEIAEKFIDKINNEQ